MTQARHIRLPLKIGTHFFLSTRNICLVCTPICIYLFIEIWLQIFISLYLRVIDYIHIILLMFLWKTCVYFKTFCLHLNTIMCLAKNGKNVEFGNYSGASQYIKCIDTLHCKNICDFILNSFLKNSIRNKCDISICLYKKILYVLCWIFFKKWIFIKVCV